MFLGLSRICIPFSDISGFGMSRIKILRRTRSSKPIPISVSGSHVTGEGT